MDKKKMCCFCGEKEAFDKIFDPNWFPKTDDEMPPINNPKSWWDVCKDCKDFIMFRQAGSPPLMLEIRPNLKKTIEKSHTVIIEPRLIKK